MALASDWDEIRRAAQLFMLCGTSLLVAFLLSRDVFLAAAKTTGGFLGGLAVLTAVMAVAYVVQERRRPTPWMGPRP